MVLREDAHVVPRGRESLLYPGVPAEPGPAPIRFCYASDGRVAVSDAAPLPDGRILLVHRRLGFDPVFTTILSVADPADIGKDAVLRSRTIGRVPVPLAENYEGAAVSVEGGRTFLRSEEHTSELQSLMRISYAVLCLQKQKNNM